METITKYVWDPVFDDAWDSSNASNLEVPE